MSAAPTWLQALLRSGFDEVFLIEAATMLLREASQSARDNLQYSAAELRQLHWAALAPKLPPAALEQLLKPTCDGQLDHTALDTALVRK
ncbi:MAG: hypothetical protein M3N23_09250, partial [Pseudomonadota bacterium]|nr:hypothetical protein [Pseudomonadota bacterium]